MPRAGPRAGKINTVAHRVNPLSRFVIQRSSNPHILSFLLFPSHARPAVFPDSRSLSFPASKKTRKFFFTFPAGLAIITKLRKYAPVAQLDRVLASGAKGRGFKSRLAYQNDSLAPWGKGIIFLPYAAHRRHITVQGGSPADERSHPAYHNECL